jgi:hypothetical protein
MSEQPGAVREICWRSIFPWLVVFRTFGLATSVPVLVLATLGALLSPLGWRVGEALFVTEPALQADDHFRQLVEWNRRWPGDPATQPAPNAGALPQSVREILTARPSIVEPLFLRFVQPVGALATSGPELTVPRAAYYVCGSLWMLLVWGFFGGAITRIAVMRLGREESIGLGSAVRHARQRYGAYVASPLFPLAGAALLGVPLVILGALLRLDWAVPVVGVCWFLALLSGLAVTILLLGLLFGWPLMWGTVAAEPNGDMFEAFTRSYSYTFQRPLHYLFYAFLATFFGALGWLLVYHFSEAVLQFTDTGAAWGAGAERWQQLTRIRDGVESGEGGLYFGAVCMNSFAGLARSVAAGFGYSFFWCLAAAVYLLLRQDTDQTEFDEVVPDAEDSSYQLPPLPPEAATAPEAMAMPGAAESASQSDSSP